MPTGNKPAEILTRAPAREYNTPRPGCLCGWVCLPIARWSRPAMGVSVLRMGAWTPHPYCVNVALTGDQVVDRRRHAGSATFHESGANSMKRNPPPYEMQAPSSSMDVGFDGATAAPTPAASHCPHSAGPSAGHAIRQGLSRGKPLGIRRPLLAGRQRTVHRST